MDEIFHKMFGIAIILGSTIIGAGIALVSNRSALREIPAKSASMMREILK